MSDDIKNEALQELAEQATEVEQTEEVQEAPQQQAEEQQVQPQEPELGDTDIPEMRHVKKEFNRLKVELDQLKQQSEIQRLQVKYSYIDTIVSMQNLEKLKQVDPEAYMAVEAAPTLYKPQG